MITDVRKLELMREAIEEAKKSKSEDDRPRPFVGAVMCDDEGNTILKAHRGEIDDGGHAEYTLFKKAADAGISSAGKTLFVTLEPCTRRNPGKTPCAVRIAMNGVKRVYIGTIDPNPSIIGRSELFLVNKGIEVERFPYSLLRELMDLNQRFFDEYTPYSLPVVEGLDQDGPASAIEGNRETLLQTSLDLIAYSKGPVSIFSGGSSWTRELQVGLLFAALQKRKVRILCEVSENENKEELKLRFSAALGAGASLVITSNKLGIRGTYVGENPSEASMLSIERAPTLHGMKLSGPHEQGLLSAMKSYFDSEWDQGEVHVGSEPRVEALEVDEVAHILKSRIEMYREAKFARAEINPGDLRLMSKNIERYKLFRITVLEEMRARNNLPEMGKIVGSPWPYMLPLVERRPDGSLVVIDGAHRVWHALNRSAPNIPVILIDGVTADLPAEPLPNLDSVVVTHQKWARTERYTNYRPAYFRPVQDAIRERLWLEVDKSQLPKL